MSTVWRQRLSWIVGVLAAVLLVFSLTVPGHQLWAELYRLSGFGGTTSPPLAIHVLDVGKADAILLECEGHLALLDAGTALHGEEVVDYLSRNRLGDHLDYVIASHPDSDHIGGMPQVLLEAECELFLRGGSFDGSYRLVTEALKKRDVPQRVVSAGDAFPLGGAVMEIIGPVSSYADPNNSSLVIRLRYQDFTALFCGDMEQEAEKDLLQTGEDLAADLLKVAHHGSKTSTTEAFLKAVSPETAVISTGPDRSNLPSESVLERLESICQDVYRTDVDGTVVFIYTDEGLRVKTEREEAGP